MVCFLTVCVSLPTQRTRAAGPEQPPGADLGCGYQSPEDSRAALKAAIESGQISDPVKRPRLPAVRWPDFGAPVLRGGPAPTVSEKDLFFYEDSTSVLTTAFTNGQLFSLMIDASNALIAAHGDEYDFIAFFLNYTPDHQIGSAFYSGVFNDVLGIGLGLFDDRDPKGLATDTLQGWVMMWNTNSWAANDTAMLVLGQEFEHRFAMFLSPLLDGRALQGDNSGCGRSAHWNWKVDGQGSGMEIREWVGSSPAVLGGTCAPGGFSFICFNSDIGTSPGGLGGVFSYTDLYLMGYVSDAEMDAGNSELRYMDTSPCSGSYSGTISTFSSADIIAANGTRSPDSTASQKNFRTGWVVFHLPGSPPNVSQTNKLVNILNRWSDTWDWSVLGRGTMDNTLVHPFDLAFVSPPPQTVSPHTSSNVDLVATNLASAPDTASGLLLYSVNGGPFLTAPLAFLGGSSFRATLPGLPCGAMVDYYIRIDAVGGGTVLAPHGAPAVRARTLAVQSAFVSDNFETDNGWSVSGSVSDGAWERGIPLGGGLRADPLADYDGSGRCWLTANRAGDSDVDGGSTTLTSPTFNLTGLVEPYVSYARWYSNAEGGGPRSDVMTIEVSSNGGTSWVNLETVGPDQFSTNPQISGGWHLRSFRIADHVPLTTQFRTRFTAADLGGGSVVEAAIDAFRIIDCAVPCPAHDGDLNGDGSTNGDDIAPFVAARISGTTDPGTVCPGDFDDSGVIDAPDEPAFIACLLAGGGC